MHSFDDIFDKVEEETFTEEEANVFAEFFFERLIKPNMRPPQHAKPEKVRFSTPKLHLKVVERRKKRKRGGHK